MEAGVPQDSVLGSLLWNITYDQVLRGVVKERCRLLRYADDTLILIAAEDVEIARERAELQIHTTIRKIKTLNLKVAAEKTEVVVFTNKRDRAIKLNINIENKNIYSARIMKYLGIILDDELNFVNH